MARSPSTNMNFWAKAPLNLVAERVKNSVPPVLRTRRFCKAKGRAVSGAGSWWGETRRGVPLLAPAPHRATRLSEQHSAPASISQPCRAVGKALHGLLADLSDGEIK